MSSPSRILTSSCLRAVHHPLHNLTRKNRPRNIERLLSRTITKNSWLNFNPEDAAFQAPSEATIHTSPRQFTPSHALPRRIQSWTNQKSKLAAEKKTKTPSPKKTIKTKLPHTQSKTIKHKRRSEHRIWWGCPDLNRSLESPSLQA